MSITGAPGEGPMRVGIPVADLTAGLFCAIGILTALLERDVSGEGQWVQTSLLQAQIFMLDFQAARWLMEKDVAKQAGNNHPTSIPTGVFKTSDGYINIATTGGRIWERCAQAIGAPELVSQSRLRHRARRARRTATRSMPRSSKLTEKKSTETWVKRTQRRRRALRSDLFDRPDVRGRPGQASRHRPGRAERREPPYPPGRPARHAVAHAEQDGGAAAGIRRADRRGAGRVRLQRTARSRSCGKPRWCEAD